VRRQHAVSPLASPINPQVPAGGGSLSLQLPASLTVATQSFCKILVPWYWFPCKRAESQRRVTLTDSRWTYLLGSHHSTHHTLLCLGETVVREDEVPGLVSRCTQRTSARRGGEDTSPASAHDVGAPSLMPLLVPTEIW
jgi:hypothetical protein